MDRTELTMDTDSATAARAVEEALYEIKRVIVGQDAMLERVLVALLVGGHVLLEGVPGLAKTLTSRRSPTWSSGPFRRVQFTPDLVPADLVGTRIYRPDTGRVLGRARAGAVQLPAGRRDQPRAREGAVRAARGDAGASGHDRGRDVPRARAVSGARHAEPDRVGGHVPAARGPDGPVPDEGSRGLPAPSARRRRSSSACSRPPDGGRGATQRWRSCWSIAGDGLAGVTSTRAAIRYAVDLADATRRPARYGLGDIAPYIEFGASPRGPIGLVQSARALALLRGRRHAVASDVRDLAADVLRHRLVLQLRGSQRRGQPG